MKSVKKNSFSKYLFLYNVFSCFGWIVVFLYTIFIQQNKFLNHHHRLIFLLKYVQTGAVLEIFHSIFGLTSSSVITTIMQVSSRLLLCWGVSSAYPEVVSKSIAFFLMSYAWSITEIIRYSYYANSLKKKASFLLSWLRYNLFFVFYPLGTSSEVWLICKLLLYIKDKRTIYPLILKVIVMVYAPGFFIMYKHMILQRRKWMKSWKAKKEKARFCFSLSKVFSVFLKQKIASQKKEDD